MDGEKIDLYRHDPPYGVEYHSARQEQRELGRHQKRDLDSEGLERFLRVGLHHNLAGALPSWCNGVHLPRYLRWRESVSPSNGVHHRRVPAVLNRRVV